MVTLGPLALGFTLGITCQFQVVCLVFVTVGFQKRTRFLVEPHGLYGICGSRNFREFVHRVGVFMANGES